MSLIYEALKRIHKDRISIDNLPGDTNPRREPAIFEVVDESHINAKLKAASSNGFRQLKVTTLEESRLVFGIKDVGLATEHYRLLRRKLMEGFPDGAVVMVTSPGERDGKTVTALNLASALADLGTPTLLIETDLRRPSLGTTLGCNIEPPGIEAALDGTVEPREAVRLISHLGLHLAAVAHPPQNPSPLLNSKELESVLGWARSHFQWVVLDTAPIVPAADVSELLHLTDFVLLVVRARRTPRELLRRAVEMLAGHTYGTMLNEVTAYSNPYYHYASRYYMRAGTARLRRKRAGCVL